VLPYGAAVSGQAFGRACEELSAALGADGPAVFRASVEEALRRAVERCGAGGPGVDAEEGPRLTVSLASRTIRDGALRWLGGPQHDAAQALWLDLTRAAPPPWGAAPATLLALHVYVRGDGAFARVSAERALTDDPDHALARLVLQLLDAGVPPDTVLAAARRPGRTGAAGGRRSRFRDWPRSEEFDR
jgi:hypothetical protein